MTQPPLEATRELRVPVAFQRRAPQPPPVDPEVARARRLLVKNLVGLALLLVAGVGACVVAFLVDPLAFAGLLCVATAAGGWHLATSEEA